jgi:hypothetical protein
MSIALRTKYLSIKKEKLSETGKTVLKSMYDATDGFKDAKATRKIKPKFEAFYDKLKKSKPEAIKGATKPKETPTAKQFKEARERRKSQTGVPKKESDIKKDADRPAIDRKGKRVTDGTHYPYKKGNVYYEYRDNRYDKRPAKYPKLEDGGMMADGGMSQGYDDREDERLSMEHGKMSSKDLNSTHARRDDAQFEERMADGGVIDNNYKNNKLLPHIKNISLDKNINGFEFDKENKMGGFLWKNKKMPEVEIYATPFYNSLNGIDYEEIVNNILVKAQDKKYKLSGNLDEDTKTYFDFVESVTKKRKFDIVSEEEEIMDSDGQTDEELYNALKDMGYKFGKYGTAKFNEDGFSETATNLGYRWNEKKKVWHNTNMMAKGGETGAAEITIELKNSVISVYHGEGGKKLYHFKAKEGDWNKIWELFYKLGGKKMAQGGEIKPEEGAASIEVSLEDGMIFIYHGEDARELYRFKAKKGDWDKIWDLLYKLGGKKMADGGMMAYGGMTPGRWYKDNQGNEFKYIGPDSTGRVLFNDGERVINKSLDDFEPNVKENKMFSWFEDGGETHRGDGGDQLFADGGKVDNGNVEMVMSNTKAIEHHAQELKKLVDMNTPIEAWVVAKLERAETDLSDVTHYIDGLKSAKFEDGGELEGHEVEIFFNTKDKVADPYTVIVDGSVYSMSGTTGPYSVNLYVGEIDEFSPQAVKGWGKKINFVNAEPELISQIESRFEDEMAGGGETKAQRERMYNFLKDDLVKLEKAIEENNQEEIERFFSYWNYHLSSLEPSMGSNRMYNFLKDDLVGLEAATKELPSSKEECDRFFSYWNTHLSSLEPNNGGMMADGGMIYKMADNMTDAEYEKKLSSLNEKQKKSYESLVRLGDSPKLALATTLLSKEAKWSDETERAYTMAKGGELATYRILEKHKYALQPKWEVEKFQTGGREFLTFKQAQDFKNKLQGMSSSFEYKVEKVPTTKIDQSKIYYMANGGETKKDFKVDDVVYHKGHNTVGIVRIEEQRGEVKTDADGNVDVDELEYYNPMKHESHKSAKIAPSTYKEVEERGLWKPFSERTSTLAKGGYLAEKTSVEVGNEKISVIKRRKEKTGYPVYVNTQGYAPMTLDVYPTKELATKKAKALANKEGYTFSNWEKVGEFNLEPYAKGGRLSRKQKQLDLNKNGKLDSQDFKMLRAKRKNARKK